MTRARRPVLDCCACLLFVWVLRLAGDIWCAAQHSAVLNRADLVRFRSDAGFGCVYFNTSISATFWYRPVCVGTGDEYFRLTRVGSADVSGTLQPTYTIQAAVDGRCWSATAAAGTFNVASWGFESNLVQCNPASSSQQFTIFRQGLSWWVAVPASIGGNSCMYFAPDGSRIAGRTGRFQFWDCSGNFSDSFMRLDGKCRRFVQLYFVIV